MVNYLYVLNVSRNPTRLVADVRGAYGSPASHSFAKYKQKIHFRIFESKNPFMVDEDEWHSQNNTSLMNKMGTNMMGNFHLENHEKWYKNRQAIETALHVYARQERTLRLQSTPYYSAPSSESRLLVSETRRMSELPVSNITAINARRVASSLEVDWQHHHASIRTCESIEAAIFAVKEEQITPTDETNKHDCFAAAIEMALHVYARQDRTLLLQSTPYSAPSSESRLLVSETERMSELPDLYITAPINELRGASSLMVDLQHHHASTRTCESIEAAILAVKEEQITPSDETNNDDCIAVPRSIDVLMGREKLAFTHVGNGHYHYLIGEYQARYDACETRIEKTIIASALIMQVKENGGRFLLRKKGETNWSEAAESVVSERVTNAFRGRRKTAIKRIKRSYDGPPDVASKRPVAPEHASATANKK
jgi:hypothetical protein